MNAQLAEWIRFGNVVLAGTSLMFLVLTLIRRWDALTPRIRRIGGACGFVLFVIAYGSGEAAKSDVPPGLRVVLMLIALATLVGALLWHFDEGI